MGPAGGVPAACLLVLALAASSALAQQAGFGRGEPQSADPDKITDPVPYITGHLEGSPDQQTQVPQRDALLLMTNGALQGAVTLGTPL